MITRQTFASTSNIRHTSRYLYVIITPHLPITFQTILRYNILYRSVYYGHVSCLLSLPFSNMMNNMNHSPAAASSSPAASCLDALLSQSSRVMQRNMQRPSSCCCGNLHCAYLETNDAALQGLENQLENAARIGQVSADIMFLILEMRESFHHPCHECI